MKILLYVSIFLILLIINAGCGLKLREDEIMGIRFSYKESEEKEVGSTKERDLLINDPATDDPAFETIK